MSNGTRVRCTAAEDFKTAVAGCVAGAVVIVWAAQDCWLLRDAPLAGVTRPADCPNLDELRESRAHAPTTAAKMTLSLLAHALALVAQPRMGLFDSLPGFWKVACPPGYARASHCLFLGTDDAAKQKAAAVLERVQSGSLTLAAAARQFRCCPTRDQEPAGDLGTTTEHRINRGRCQG